MTHKEAIISEFLEDTNTLAQLIYLSQELEKNKKNSELTYCPHCVIYKTLGIDKVECQKYYNKGGGCLQSISNFLDTHRK